MIALLKKTLGGKKIMRPAVVGVTDFSTGNYLTYYLQEISEQDILEAIQGSSSIPTLFPYIVKNNSVLGNIIFTYL